MIGRVVAFVIVFVALGAATSPATPTYSVQDLGTIDGTGGAYATGLNSRGQVVGYGAVGGVREHAYLYDGSMHDLGTLGGFLQNSYAFGINDAGQVVGSSETGDPPDPNGFAVARAFVYGNEVMQDLGALPGGLDSQALAINRDGKVTGWGTARKNLDQTAILYGDGQLKPLLASRDSTSGHSINSAGSVAGEMNGAAFFYDGSAHLLTAPSVHGIAAGINDRGEVAGWADIGPGGAQRAFLFDGTLHDLGTLPGGTFSDAFAINNRGDIVGTADTADHGTVFLYTGGTMYDLNTLLDADPGFRIVQVRGINDLGQIAGTAFIDGQLHPVLLTPVPEPGSVAAAMVLATAMLLRRRRENQRK